MDNSQDSRPFLSSFTDRHGTIRWRFRRAGKTISIPGQPGDPEFEERYLAAVEGRKPRIASIQRMPGAALPGSFRQAWLKVRRTPEWIAHDPATKDKNERLAKVFLDLPVVDGHPAMWGDMPVRDLRRRHVKDIIGRFSETPHKAKHLLVMLRKMITVALDEEWIDSDPTWRLNYTPAYIGWRAWTDAERALFEARWPLGSAPRTAYAIALWLGNRRSDVVRLRWDWFDFQKGVAAIETKKGKKRLILPITPMLRDALDAVEKRGETVLVTQYGKPFSEKSITGRMRVWTEAAGMPTGCTLHGLRKTLGKMLAESGASTRQLMEMLGHDDIEHAELYSREAEQQRMARDAMTRLTRQVQKKSKG